MSETHGETQDATPAASGASTEKALFNEKLRFLEKSDSLKKAIIVLRDQSTSTVLEDMRKAKEGGVLITDDSKKLVGIFTSRDYLDEIAGMDKDLSAPIEQYMTTSPKVLKPDHTVGDAIRLMTKGDYRHVPVVNEDGTIFAMVSVRDIINYISEHFPEEVFNHPPIIHQHIETQEGG